MPIHPVAQEQLGERVARQLRRMIVTGELARGTVIVADDLAAEFGTSRGPVRDAVRTLIGEGLIDSKGRRAVIRGLRPHDVDELYSLRHLLESTALHRSMDNDLPGLTAALKASLDDMRRAVETGGHEAFTVADADFHSQFFVFSRHRRITTIWNQYRASVETILLVSRITWQDVQPSFERHVLLHDLIASGDHDAVDRELTAHLEDARQRVRHSLDDAVFETDAVAASA
ncbi:MAG: GntR family transcriptional regulator [Propioniciclava sp.]|uniref:GntR family transcriptional regulator n=1 Tax=Propioniciclava sp. TaxID=2038686 RepID=UPI0039E5E576